MLKKDLIGLLNDINEDGDIDEILSSTEVFKKNVSLEHFKELISDNNEFKSFMDSEKDKHSEKAIKTWKANNLSNLIEKEVTKKLGQPETPEQKAIRELKAQIDAMNREKTKAEMESRFKDVLNKKSIPLSMISFLLGEDDESTNNNINLFEESMKSFIDTNVAAKLNDSKYTPPKGTEPKGLTKEQFNKMNLYEQQLLKNDKPDVYNELVGKGE